MAKQPRHRSPLGNYSQVNKGNTKNMEEVGGMRWGEIDKCSEKYSELLEN
jgi:hypothetical protein